LGASREELQLGFEIRGRRDENRAQVDGNAENPNKESREKKRSLSIGGRRNDEEKIRPKQTGKQENLD